MDEHELIDSIRKHMNDAKAALKNASQACRGVADINTSEGRLREANAALRVKASCRRLLGEVEEAHTFGTELLFEFWPDHADEIVTRAGHR